MCWERKNKSFIPTRMTEWHRNLPQQSRTCPPAFQERRWAIVKWAGTRGHMWGLGAAGQVEKGTVGVRDRAQTGARRADPPHKPCTRAAGRP